MEKVCVVIPFYNGDKYIEACLESLAHGSCANTEKIVVNNSDKPTKIHAIATHFQNVSVVDTNPRIGFGCACNQGAQIGIERGAEFIIILNQDSIADRELVAALISPFNGSHKIAIAAPIPYNHDFSSIDKHFIIKYLSMCPDLFVDALNNTLKPRYTLDAVAGACFAIRSDFIERYGLFDPIYFMYYEDDDLCRRVKRLNYDIVVVPTAKLGHYDQAAIAMQKQPSRSYERSMQVKLWLRHSASIFQLKDINRSLLRVHFKLSLSNILDYIRYILSLQGLNLLYALISDVNLIIKMPKVVRSRNAERKLFREAHLAQFPS